MVKGSDFKSDVRIPRDSLDDPLQNVGKAGMARVTWPPDIHLADICTVWAPSSSLHWL